MIGDNKLTFLGILTSLSLFVLPFLDSSSIFYGSVNSKYFFIILISSISVLYFSYLIFTKKTTLFSWKNRWLLILSTIFLIVHYVSAFAGVDLERSLWSDITRSTGVLFLSALSLFIFILSETLSKKDWNFIFGSIAISSTLFAMFSYLSPEGLNVIQKHGLSFGNTTFAGAYLLLGLVSTLFLFFKTESRSFKKVLLICLCLQLLSPFLINLKSLPHIFSNPVDILGSARASGATAILMIVYFFGIILIKKFFTKNSTKVSLLWLSLLIVSISFGITQLFTAGSFIQNKYIESSTAARIILWESSLKSVDERPVFGWGPENLRYAYESKTDLRLAYKENFGEIWFDKAHNIFVDTLVSVGYLGLFVMFAIIFYVFILLKRLKDKESLGLEESLILAIIPFAHVLQLQTGFDTSASYFLMGLILAYLLSLEKGLVLDTSAITEKKIHSFLSKVFAGILVIISVFGFYKMFIVELSEQNNLFQIFNKKESVEHVDLINGSFNNNIDFESLRLSSASLIKGTLEYMAQGGSNPLVLQSGMDQLKTYENLYDRYLEKSPYDYRIRMNYINLLNTMTILGENRLDKAEKIVSESYELSPNNNLTFAMDALINLYKGDINLAIDKAKEAVALDPRVELSSEVLEHIELQKENFPNISVLKLHNL